MIDFKELAYVIIEAGKSKICRVGWQAKRLREKQMLQFKSEGRLLAEFPLARGEVSLCSSQAFN